MDSLKYTVIKNRKQYNEYCRILDQLIEPDESTKEQDEEIQLLTVLIEKWDAEHSHFKDLDPVEIIRSLMKEHRLSPSDLMRILDISKSYLSEILNYKKGLSKDVIRKLAAHFKMTQEAFNRPYPLKLATPTILKQKTKSQRQLRRPKSAKKRLQKHRSIPV